MIHDPTTMLSIIKTATKESLFYKLPTLVGDILIQVGVLVLLLYGTDMVRENNLPLYEQAGSSWWSAPSRLPGFSGSRSAIAAEVP